MNHLLGKKARRNRIVFSVPGIVDSLKNKLLYAPNLKWHDVDFKEYFGKKVFEVIVDNDSNLSLLVESFFSNDIKDKNNAFFLYLGEGVGRSIIDRWENCERDEFRCWRGWPYDLANQR
ncbi:MAG: ROK family protein [Pseudothermotoga sp.]